MPVFEDSITEQYLTYGENGYGALLYPDSQGQAVETNIVNKVLSPVPRPHLTGMKLKEDIIIGDLVLNSIDEDNVVWVCTDIEGWWVHPDPEIPDVTRGWRDGSYDARGRWTARQLTLNGVFLPPDPSYTSAARDKLIRATNLVYTGAWLKTKENPTRASYVRLSGRPNISNVSPRGKTEFSIGLRAADPIKYSWNESDPDGYDSVTIPAKKLGTVTVNSYPTSTQITNAGLPASLYPTGAPIPAVLGNLTLTARPLVANYGVVETLLAFTFNDGSHEVVIPRVVSGAIVTSTAAIAHYNSTGQHLGKFNSGSIEYAESYATKLNDIQTDWLELVNYSYDGESGSDTITNDGNYDVAVFLEVTGPSTGDLTIINETNGEVLTIIDTLRGSETKTVTNKILSSNVATLTFSSTHTIVEGDTITVSGVDSTFNGEYEVTDVPSNTSISFAKEAQNVPSTAVASGSVVRNADILEIDTYEREVAYNGVTLGARVMIDTLTDWVVLASGENVIRFTDEGTNNGSASLKVYYRSGWIG